MSASEKLGRLMKLQEIEGRFPSFPEQDDVLAALPAIKAVVEAAENAREIEDYIISEYKPEGTDLERALAALDAALGDET